MLGLLEAYWELYEAVGMNLYTDYNYLEQVWAYHQQMVDSICVGNDELGYQALVQHKDLLFTVLNQVSLRRKMLLRKKTSIAGIIIGVKMSAKQISERTETGPDGARDQ